jgi:hypothetical protein
VIVRRLARLHWLALLPLMACGPSPRENLRATTEFLVVSDDSTAWVRTFADTVAVTRAPMLVALLDGRLIEIYVAEDPIDFAESTFLVTRVFRRDLVSGDSSLVFADSTVLREANAYMRAHPTAERLQEEEPATPGARALEASITPMNVVGHTLGLEVHVDRTIGEIGMHDTYRATVDLRTGARLTIADVASRGSAPATLQRARRDFDSAVVVLARRGAGTAGQAASRAMAELIFDSLSFTLSRSGDSLAAQFLVHDEQVIDETRDTHRFALEPVALTPPPWWNGARALLPRLQPDSSTRVEVGQVPLVIVYDSEDVAQIASRTGLGTRALLRMRGPVRQVIAVGDSIVQPAGQWRQALERAFSESGYYSDQVRAASLRSRARPTAARQAAL